MFLQKVTIVEVQNTLSKRGFVSGIHNRVMLGRSAFSIAHYVRSEDGKSKFASKPANNNTVEGIPFVGEHICQTIVESLCLSLHAASYGQN